MVKDVISLRLVEQVLMLVFQFVSAGFVSLAVMMVVTKSGRSVLRSWYEFNSAITYFLVRGGTYDGCPYFRDVKERQAKVQVFSLVLIFSLWDKPHYRNGTFQDDMIKNLRNVAVRFFLISKGLFLILNERTNERTNNNNNRYQARVFLYRSLLIQKYCVTCFCSVDIPSWLWCQP